MPKVGFKPGTEVPKSGQYKPIGPRGGTGGKIEITAVEGKRFPPTPQKGITYKLVDPTKHKK